MLVLSSPSHAEVSGDSLAAAPPHPAVVFAPDRPDRCDFFFVTEFSASTTAAHSQNGEDDFIFTDALGLMRNVGRSQAVGLSIDAHVAAGNTRFVPTLRFKQWLAGRQSVDVLVGYAVDDPLREGVVGPIVDLRYSPNAWFYVQAGACRVRSISSIFYYPEYQVNQESPLRFHAGLGLGGVAGVASWGAQAIAIVGLLVAFSHMN